MGSVLIQLAAFTLAAVVITLVILGAVFRPYVQALVAERDLWRDRAIAAEDAAKAYEYEGVRLIDPAGPELDIWLQGVGPHEQDDV